MLPDRASRRISSYDTRNHHMHEQEVELGIGDVVRIGDHLLTVIDVEGDDVSFRIDLITEPRVPFELASSAARPPR